MFCGGLCIGVVVFSTIYFWDLLDSGGVRYVSKTYKNSASKKENKKAKKVHRQ